MKFLSLRSPRPSRLRVEVVNPQSAIRNPQCLFLALLLVYFGIFFHGLLFLTEGVTERDGFYHARYAQLLPERGLSRSFPWMQFTVWKDQFCDKDFLYHVFLAPFCQNQAEPLPGAKWATLTLALLTLAAMYFVLKRFRAPWPLFWTALLASGSALLINRMMMVRSHDLSILLMIVAAWAILERHAWLCFIAAFIYAWSYSFPLAMLITALAAEGGRVAFRVRGSWFRVQGEDPNPKPGTRNPGLVLATAMGLSAGLLIHPYSPYSFTSIWMFLHVTFSAAAGGEIELGSEFRPLPVADAFTISPGLTAAFLVAFVLGLLLRFGAIRGRKLSGESAAALGAATVWFTGMFVFQRMIEYAGPLSVLAAALVVRDASGSAGILPPKAGGTPALPGNRVKFLSIAALLTLALAACHYWSGLLVREYVLNINRSFYSSEAAFYRGRHFEGAAAWMKAKLKPHTVVLNFHWDDFPELFYVASEEYYIVGLDPTFMRLSYPAETRELEVMRTANQPLDFAKLRAMFNTDYMVMRRYRAEKYGLLTANRDRVKFEDSEAVVCHLGEP